MNILDKQIFEITTDNLENLMNGQIGFETAPADPELKYRMWGAKDLGTGTYGSNGYVTRFLALDEPARVKELIVKDKDVKGKMFVDNDGENDYLCIQSETSGIKFQQDIMDRLIISGSGDVFIGCSSTDLYGDYERTLLVYSESSSCITLKNNMRHVHFVLDGPECSLNVISGGDIGYLKLSSDNINLEGNVEIKNYGVVSEDNPPLKIDFGNDYIKFFKMEETVDLPGTRCGLIYAKVKYGEGGEDEVRIPVYHLVST